MAKSAIIVSRTDRGWKVDYDAVTPDLVEYYSSFKAASAAAKEHHMEINAIEAEYAMDQAISKAREAYDEEG